MQFMRKTSELKIFGGQSFPTVTGVLLYCRSACTAGWLHNMDESEHDLPWYILVLYIVTADKELLTCTETGYNLYTDRKKTFVLKRKLSCSQQCPWEYTYSGYRSECSRNALRSLWSSKCECYANSHQKGLLQHIELLMLICARWVHWLPGVTTLSVPGSLTLGCIQKAYRITLQIFIFYLFF